MRIVLARRVAGCEWHGIRSFRSLEYLDCRHFQTTMHWPLSMAFRRMSDGSLERSNSRSRMMRDGNIYGRVDSRTGMKKVFAKIRKDVENARSRPALTELYKRAGYLITLTHAPSWEEKFGRGAKTLRKVGEEEFRKTARKINRRAAQIGADADFDEKWGKGR